MPEVLDPVRAAPVIDCAAYRAGVRVTDVGIDQIRDTLEHPDQFVLLGLYEPEKDILRGAQQQFGLHDLAVEYAYNAHQRPKLELYEDSVFVVLRTAHLTTAPRHLEFGETHIFLGPRYMVTVRHGASLSYKPVRARCEREPELLALGPIYTLYAVFDFKRRIVTMSNSGLPYPVVRRRNQAEGGEAARQIELPGVPLGSFSGSNYDEMTLDLHVGDLYVFCSDGVTEAVDPLMREFGAARLLAAIDELHERPARAIVDGIFAAVHEFRGEMAPNDDMTAVVIKITG